jgi:hypothetical protein
VGVGWWWMKRKNGVMLLRGIAVVEIDQPHEFIYIAGADLREFVRKSVWYGV